MTGRFLALALAALSFVALPAHACIDSSNETYVFFDTPPASVPIGIMVVKVLAREIEGGGTVDILAPVDGLRGEQKIDVDPGFWTGCSRWGRLGGPAYIVGMLRRASGGRVVLEALQLRRRYAHFPSVRATDSFIVDPEYLRLALQHPRLK